MSKHDKLIAWVRDRERIQPTPEQLAERLTVESLPHEQTPRWAAPLVVGFRKLRQDARVQACRAFLQRNPCASEVRWKPDHDDAKSVDDFSADGVKLVRFERMSSSSYWFCVYLDDGTEHHFDFYVEKGKRVMRCFARQPQSEGASK